MPAKWGAQLADSASRQKLSLTNFPSMKGTPPVANLSELQRASSFGKVNWPQMRRCVCRKFDSARREATGSIGVTRSSGGRISLGRLGFCGRGHRCAPGLQPVSSLLRRENSLFFAENSLLTTKKFPVPLRGLFFCLEPAASDHCRAC
jgi:hypothetical protein